jgi:uncharacterized protein (DUF885 family)
MKEIFTGFMCLFSTICFGQQVDFAQFADKFVTGYQSLHIPDLELSYVSDFDDIKSADSVEIQIKFFSAVKTGLLAYKMNALTPAQQQDELQIAYETDLNLQRLALEKQWLANKPDSISTKGIYTVPNGRQWYIYLLKRWLTDDVTTDQVYQFGLDEVKNVKEHIEAIRRKTGLSEDSFYRHLNDPEFFTSDPKFVQHLFEEAKDSIYHHLDRVFNQHAIPPLIIKRGESARLAQAPGYYDNNTFYYNLSTTHYNIRQVDWLFLHEGVPGHHYQTSVYSDQKHSKVADQFFYLCYAEGWACYTEDLGGKIGLYKTPYSELGKWEWDIVRAVRIPMDIGLNYYGWTDAQALVFWKTNIRGQDDIAMREIARVKRWPVQAITYNYGAAQIKAMRDKLQKMQGAKFDIKDFHDRVLSAGVLPWFMVQKYAR